MSLIVEYITSFAPWIYGLCGLIALYYLYQVRLIRAERRQAVFALERERAARLLTRLLARVTVLVLAMGLTYLVSDVMARAMVIERTAQPGNNETFGAPSLPGSESAAAVTPLPGLDASGAAGDLELRNIPACDGESAAIQSPGVEEEITGTASVMGTAAHEAFAEYRIEMAPGIDPLDEDFTVMGIGRNQVRSGVLWEIDASTLITGPYTLRLRLVDTDGAFAAACQVAIRVVAS